jgi:hypothetical protein
MQNPRRHYAGEGPELDRGGSVLDSTALAFEVQASRLIDAFRLPPAVARLVCELQSGAMHGRATR